MRRLFPMAVMAAVLLVLGLLWRQARTPPGYNVLLITLDTTRADRVGCYGYAPAATPALDALADRGLRFTRAFTHVPLTLPSHATIMTGLYPPEHGLRHNDSGRLVPGIRTLAEVLKKQRYRTAAFIGSFVLHSQFGLNRGFDVYDDRLAPPNEGRGTPTGTENRADVVCDRALQWLQRNADAPFFCWVHLFDPHDPYTPPAPYRARHRDPYDGEVAFMDSQIQRLLDFLERRGRRKTLIVACGDHGEALGEHGEYGHGLFLYDETMRVPLILCMPGCIPAGTTDRTAGLADIPATILQLLGQRADTMPGQSLLSSPVTEEPCYGEALFGAHTRYWVPFSSLTTTRWKFIDASVPELYDRAEDPREMKNLADAQPGVTLDMKTRLADIRASMRVPPAGMAQLDPDTLGKLHSLGYLGGSEPTGMRRVKAPKPGELFVHNLTAQVRRLMALGDYTQATVLLKPAMPFCSRTWTEPRVLLAECWLELEQYTKAQPLVDAVLAVEPVNKQMLVALGRIYLAQERFADAVTVLGKALALPEERSTQFGITGRARSCMTAALAGLNRVEKMGPPPRVPRQDDSGKLETVVVPKK